MKVKTESQAAELAEAAIKAEAQETDIASFNEKRKAIIKDANEKIKRVQDKNKEIAAERDALKSQLEAVSAKPTEVENRFSAPCGLTLCTGIGRRSPPAGLAFAADAQNSVR